MILYTLKGHAESNHADLRMKISVIKHDTHKYSVSATCKVLQIPRSMYYYESKPKKDEFQLVTNIIEIFLRSRNNYKITILSEGKIYPFDGYRQEKLSRNKKTWTNCFSSWYRSYHEIGKINI